MKNGQSSRTPGLTDGGEPTGSRSVGRWLTEPEGMAAVEAYGIPFPVSEVSAPEETAVLEAAARIGYPVVLKAVSPDIVHKTEAGAVELGLSGAEDVSVGLRRMLDGVRHKAPEARVHAVLVAAEAPAGLEVIVGARRDPQFGPVLAVGLGGVYVELLKQVSLRLCPVSSAVAAEMLDETAVAPLLAGPRGASPLDRAALEDLLVGVSRFATEAEDMLELDLNPVRVFRQGLLALDVRLRRAAGEHDSGARAQE